MVNFPINALKLSTNPMINEGGSLIFLDLILFLCENLVHFLYVCLISSPADERDENEKQKDF